MKTLFNYHNFFLFSGRALISRCRAPFGRAARCKSALIPAFAAIRCGLSARIPHAKIVAIGVLFATSAAFAQQQTDSIKTNPLDEVLVSAVRVNSKTPVSFSNLTKAEIKPRNLGQDIPILMNFMPSVVTTSDAGNGVGYTGIRVRGSDATRVNVTINGIPYNDSESHGTFWVNMPDFSSSVESLQLQRGVGTSTNGAGAFGASLNLLTERFSEKSAGEISNSYGSFNTRKHTVKFSTGLLNERFELAGRLSNIASDGYIDRGASNLKSYFLQGTYVSKNTLVKALAFGGTEKTYQSWYGLEDAEKLENNRTYNVSGIYTDEFGNTRFYDNQTDNYQQDHYQLHFNHKVSGHWNANLAFHYTKGKGYYENYEENASFDEFGLTPIGDVSETDLINQKWLDNDFYGTTFSLNYKGQKLDMILGGGWNKYNGNHFGKIIWARFASQSQPDDRYYDDDAIKADGNVFAKAYYKIGNNLNIFGDLQYRRVSYKTDGAQPEFVDDVFDFFNPKGGITLTLNTKCSLYFSYAKANREPNRDDYENGNPEPEQLDDFELGWRFDSAAVKLNVNGYYMKYKNQLVLTGALNDVGSPIRKNVGDSYRAGLEVEANIKLSNRIYFRPNLTVSQSKNRDFYFQRNGAVQNLGDTNIAFSPDIIAASQIIILPFKGLQVNLLSKFVGDQYMGNIDSETSKLRSYAVSDLNVSYEIRTNKIFKSIVINALVNNILDYQYESNGYFYTYDDDFSDPDVITTIEGAGFYSQAGINFIAGLTLNF